ncbi:AGAP013184-PA-like protein [Anopheles sinensis]|uniref:AGAP013184-PA-like protein n=1 Tax=Anopheles sinensis TaxID=74873 RepID=A0A084VUG7_ANOSI|nr:AGAP013184-PA-like protein [Anopheles sinensis]
MESSTTVRHHSGTILHGWLVCCIALGFFGSKVFAGETRGQVCYTEDGTRGRCVLVRQCPLILDILRKKIHSNEDIWHVYGSQCGSLPDGKAQVCCVQNSTNAAQPTAIRTKLGDSNQNQPADSGVTEPTASNRPQCGVQPGARETIIEGTHRNIGFHPWSVLLHGGNRRK